MGEVFLRDGAAEVLNREPRLPFVLRERQLHPPACRLIFQGIFQQAADDALQVVRIAAQDTCLGERRFQRDAFLIGDGFHLQRRLCGDGGKVDRLHGKRRARSLHIGEREHLGDELLHPLGGLLRAVHPAADAAHRRFRIL